MPDGENIGSAHGSIEIDLSSLNRSRVEAKASLTILQQAFQKVGEDGDAAGRRLNEAMQQTVTGLRAASAGMAGLAHSTAPVTAGITAAGKASETTSKEVDDLGKSAKGAGDKLDTTNKKVQEGGQHLTKFESITKAVGSTVQGIFQGIGQRITSAIQSIIESVAGLGKELVTSNSQFETYRTQFKVMLGSVDAAQKRMEELAEFGAKTPFELPGVVEADRILTGFGLETQEAAKKFGYSASQIRTIAGDVASGAGTSFQELSKYLGMFSTGATGLAIARFQELGVVTRDQLTKMGLQFSTAGQLLSPLPQAFNTLLGVLKTKYGGMMAEQSATLDGMLSNLADWRGQAIRILGEPIFDEVKADVTDLLAFLSKPETTNALRNFAVGIATGIRAARENFLDFSRGVQLVYTTMQPLFAFIKTNALPLMDALTAASITYAAVQSLKVALSVAQATTSILASLPALAAQATALYVSAAAAIAAAAPFIALTAAITGTIMVIQKYQSINADAVQMFLKSNQTYQDGVKALERYESASYSVRKATQSQADELKGLQAQQEQDLILRAQMVRAGQTESDAYRENTNRINERTDKIKISTAALEGDITAAQEAGPALDAMSDDIQNLGFKAEETAKHLQELQKAAEDAAKAGEEAFSNSVQAEVGFLADRSTAHEKFSADQQEIEKDFQDKLLTLQSDYGKASTAQQRSSISEQINDLVKGYQEKKGASQASFDEQEKTAAESYAREQAAQLAHLGQMLIDFATAKAEMAGVSDEALAQLTSKISAEYGVQQSIVGRSYTQMTQDIQTWADNHGQNTDQVVADMSKVRESTVAMQQEVDKQISLMTAQAKKEFDDGKITVEQYAEKLRLIPQAAEDAATALAKIPKRVESEVVVTTVNRSKQRQGGEVTDDSGPAAREPAGVAGGVSGRRAFGGPVIGGLPYLVGERRKPEVFVPAQSGFVLPDAKAAMDALAGLRGTPTQLPSGTTRSAPTVNLGGVHISLPGAVVDNAERLQAVANHITQQVMGQVSSLLDQMYNEGI